MRALLSIILAAAITPLDRPMTHQEEIASFASTMAIVRTFAKTCAGTTINETYLEDLRQRLHVVVADHPYFAERAREVVASLRDGLAQAPSREAWCDNLYALYGPSGTMIPRLLSRNQK